MKAINHKVAFSICQENEHNTRSPEGTCLVEGLGLWGGLGVRGRISTQKRERSTSKPKRVVLTDSRSRQRAEVREHSSMCLLVVRIRRAIRHQTQSALCFTARTSIWVCVTCLAVLFSVTKQLESGSSSLPLLVMGCFDSQSASCAL